MALRAITEKAIVEAFARIEQALLASMIRNLKKHQVDQINEGFEWERWQEIQLTELDRYARNNLRTYGKEFDEINQAVSTLIENSYEAGLSRFERLKLRAMQLGRNLVQGARSLLGIPAERLDALVEATHSDLIKAEYATLRNAEDIYKQVVFNAQVYATSGAGTYAQAIDMATNDFLDRGITGIVYKNGSRHSIREYSQMAVRTATKRAALVSEGAMRQEWGVHTIIVNPRATACPVCMRWVGQVLVDDVYSGGTAEEAEEMGYTLLSEAMDEGLFHPNCQDTATTYFPGITELPPKPTRDDLRAAEEREQLENDISNAKASERRYERLANFSLDSENKRKAKHMADRAAERVESLELEQEKDKLREEIREALEDLPLAQTELTGKERAKYQARTDAKQLMPLLERASELGLIDYQKTVNDFLGNDDDIRDLFAHVALASNNHEVIQAIKELDRSGTNIDLLIGKDYWEIKSPTADGDNKSPLRFVEGAIREAKRQFRDLPESEDNKIRLILNARYTLLDDEAIKKRLQQFISAEGVERLVLVTKTGELVEIK